MYMDRICLPGRPLSLISLTHCLARLGMLLAQASRSLGSMRVYCIPNSFSQRWRIAAVLPTRRSTCILFHALPELLSACLTSSGKLSHLSALKFSEWIEAAPNPASSA